MNQFLCHLVGDYLLQSNWMAKNKAKSSGVALSHAIAYTVPFIASGATRKQSLLIAGTHFVVDRFRLARYVVWAKDFIAPKGEKHELTPTGYQDDVPPFLATWLMIIADNTIHMLINNKVLDKNK